MSDINRVNQFLLDVLNAKKSYSISSKQVYSMLIRNDVDPKDIGLDASVNGNFDRWCQEFGRYNGKNIDVFVDPSWSYFCQFKNRHNEVMEKDDQVKVYIPLDGAHLTHGVEQIFDFLEKNNIAHLSKVGKHIRFDDVVVRLGSLEDAEKLSQFINGNRYIQEGLVKPNPFAVTKDGIAFASDRDISYNSTVASFVNMYVDDVRKKNDFSTFGAEGFRNFIKNYYNEVIINPSNYNRLASDFDIKYDNGLMSYNYARVAELLYSSLDPNFTYNDYRNYYNRNVNDYYRQPELAYNNGVTYPERDIEKTKDLSEILGKNPEDVKVEELMKKALIEFGKKTLPNGSRKYSNEDVVSQIYEYFNTGNPNYITSSGGLRQDFIENDFRTMLSNYVSRNGVSFGDVLLESKKQILEESLAANYKKYGEEADLGYSIRRLLDQNNYEGFTRSGKARDNMAAAVGANDIGKIILKEMNYPPNVTFANFTKTDRNQIIEQYAESVRQKITSNGYGGK